ncbi:hypothetical protein C8Q73DRAFT_86811 [Cubamyces lactineus]|nr:hypothetical protein C8Q73DRAFT_86811 [Cubamyces lactineus]
MLSMHQALSCADILDDIFEWLALAYSDTLWSTTEGHIAGTCTSRALRGARNDLASAACVCRSFHEPAARILWRKLDGIFPALKLLPGFIEEWDSDGGHNGHPAIRKKRWTFPKTSDVPSCDWDRFYRYTVSVQIIGFPSQPSHAFPECISGKSWSSLVELFQGRSPFPNLRKLSWTADEFGLIMIPPLLSPYLADITIRPVDETDLTLEDVPVSTRHLDALLQELCKPGTPQLTAFTFYTCRPTTAPQVLVGLRVPYPTLRFLSLICDLRGESNRPNVQLADLAALSHFPLLERLVLRGLRFESEDSTNSQGRPIELPNLGKLRLESTTNAHLVLQNLCTPALRALHVDNLFILDSTGIEWNSISWLPPLPALEVLNCKFSLMFANSATPISTLFASISTLERPRSLSIHCRSCRNVVVGDEDLTAVSQALPALETLSIRLRLLPLSEGFHSISMSGLATLVHSCPQLRELELPLLRVRTEDLVHMPGEPVAHGLRRLWLEEGWTPELHSLIRDRLCPNLEDIPDPEAQAVLPTD